MPRAWRRFIAVTRHGPPGLETIARTRRPATRADPEIGTDRNSSPNGSIFKDLLPDEPTVVLEAANALFPDRIKQKEVRQKYLERVREAARKLPRPTSASQVALAKVEYELGDPVAALAAWKRAVDQAPRDVQLRNDYAKWLEEEELYDLLVTELEWLRSNKAGGYNIIDRARRGPPCRRSPASAQQITSPPANPCPATLTKPNG